ncbi:putative bifunctional diguanylate cyclase/phosphodiesterase [Acidovorax sp. BL-A-41-H1]|uniref:putative bifunctional diguanylate cyclase/phosphodiesterase n=1 Tax=Acidovorax sp. BL-A-41-H1 TaxID=3421102 RepID=UPI003F7A6B0C
MPSTLIDELRTVANGVRTLYGDDGATAGRMRFEHLTAVVRLTPVAMAANVGNASLLLWAFHGQWTVGLVAWWCVMVIMASMATWRWLTFRRKPLAVVSCRGIHRATLHAALLAANWAVLPIAWFADASHGQQLAIATLFTGMMGAGTFVLGALPLASLAYVLLFAASSLIALLMTHDPIMAGVAVLVGLYAVMVYVGGMSYWRKATALMLSQGEAVRHEQMLEVMLRDFEQNATDALWETDRQGHLRHPSPRLVKLMRTSAEQLVTLSLEQWLHQHCTQGAQEVAGALRKGLPFHSLMVTLEHEGHRHHLAFNGKPLFDELGQPGGWRGVLADRTTVVRAQDQLHRLAHTDSLTQLANRFALHTAIAEQLHAGSHGGALLLLDLDHFKAVNDSFGHSTGDALLSGVAARLRQHAPEGSLVARLGGDEFAVLLRPATDAAVQGDAPESDAEQLAASLVSALGRPYLTGERRLRIGASIGVAHMDDEVTSVDELLVRADIALYEAKGQGRGRAAGYTSALRQRTQRRATIEEGLRQAVQQDQLSLHWQPKVDLATWKVNGAEALMRWDHPEMGRVSPGEFIPVAEQGGLIELIGLWGLRHACECAQRQLPGIVVAVNVSAVQLADPQFVQLVQSVLESTGLPAHRLELEITESIFIEDTAAALQQLHALHAIGVRIALDDFGTGYSSLSYLCQFPFSTLKIDRSFVEEAMIRPEALAVVHGIAQLARSLGMKTVCEGIETPEQLAMVIGARIDEAQGYLLSAPRPLEHFRSFTEGWDTNLAPLEFLPPLAAGKSATPAPGR